MSPDDDDRLTRIEEKLDALNNSINEIKLNMVKEIDSLDSRVKLLESWQRDKEQHPKNVYYKWALVASWVSIGIAFAALIFK